MKIIWRKIVELDHLRLSRRTETGAEIVAEGIETAEEMTTLIELGVDFGQGYFFDRALEIDQAVKRIKLGTAARFSVSRELCP